MYTKKGPQYYIMLHILIGFSASIEDVKMLCRNVNGEMDGAIFVSHPPLKAKETHIQVDICYYLYTTPHNRPN